MRTFVAMGLAAAVLLGTSSVTTTVQAQDHRPDRDWHGRDWHDRDIHRFHEHDIERWRAGRWVRGRHDGRVGWWWVVGPSWYFYPAPIYPYPDPYRPPVVAGPPTQFYYYCDNPAGYYPYVPACPTPWRPVPAG